MKLFFYRDTRSESHGSAEELIGGMVSPGQFHCCETVAQMIDQLRTNVRSQDIVILLLGTGGELNGFLAEQELFEDIRLILVLPDTNPELVALGHQLRPRFVDISQNNDFSKVKAVLAKMMRSPPTNRL
ncbi:MAG: hypothetical protein ABFS09_11685 [Thermodesulfobacteriota bacterium]